MNQQEYEVALAKKDEEITRLRLSVKKMTEARDRISAAHTVVVTKIAELRNTVFKEDGWR